MVSGSDDNTVRLWDSETRQAIGQPMAGHTSSVRSVAFSPEGRYVVSGSWDNTVRLWDSERRQAIGQPMAGHTNWVTSVAFSPDGRYVVSGSDDNTVRLWDSERRQAIGQPMAGHTSCVKSVAFSPEGRYVVSGSRDKTVRLWDVAELKARGCTTGKILLTWHQEINSIALTPYSLKKAAKASEEKSSPVFSDPRHLISEDMLVMGDAAGTISFWAISHGPNPSARFLGMPKHSGMPLLFNSAQLSRCQMHDMSRRLLEQNGADVSQVIVQEGKTEPSSVLSPKSTGSPGKTGWFAPKAKSPSPKSPVDPQSLLAEVLKLLNEVYPDDDADVAKERKTMLAKLKPYQDRQASLTSTDRAGLMKLQLTLLEVQHASQTSQRRTCGIS